MFESLNHSLFLFVALHDDAHGLPPFGIVVLAEWTIFAAPMLLVLLWLFGDREDRLAAVGACMAVVAALAIAGAIASAFFHPRPFMDGLSRNFLRHAVDSSFPSDHATLFFALAFSMLLTPPAVIRWLWLMPMGLALSVGWARVALGAHYPFDVFGAAIVGLVAACCIASTPGQRLRDAVTGFAERLYTWPMERKRRRRP